MCKCVLWKISKKNLSLIKKSSVSLVISCWGYESQENNRQLADPVRSVGTRTKYAVCKCPEVSAFVSRLLVKQLKILNIFRAIHTKTCWRRNLRRCLSLVFRDYYEDYFSVLVIDRYLPRIPQNFRKLS